MPEHNISCPCALLWARDNSVLCPSVNGMEIAPLFPYYHLDGAEMITYYITSDKNNFLILFCLLVIRWSCLVLLGVKGIRVPDLCILFMTHGLSKAEVESAGDLLDAWEEYFTLYWYWLSVHITQFLPEGFYRTHISPYYSRKNLVISSEGSFPPQSPQSIAFRGNM